jgi:SOS regulatory protein LexA
MDESYKEKIRHFYRDRHRMPTYSEIMKLVKFRSKSSVHKLVRRLEDVNFLKRDRNGSLLPERLFRDTMMAGYVSAGFPSPAEEELLDTISLDDYLIRNKESTFMLKVNGDSMVDAGIFEDDLVLVEKGTDFKDRDIVIASVDGEWTMKYLRKRGKKLWLEAANKKYAPIYPENGMELAAVVRAVIRRY